MPRAKPVSMHVNSKQRQFDALTRAHAADLYRFALWLCGRDALAQDLVQETLLRAWKSLHTLRDAQSARPWLLTILRRENARLYERKRLETVDIDAHDVPDDTIWSNPERHGNAADIRDAMRQLPPKYREPLLLQVLGGFSCREIADELGEKPGAVMTRLFRARQKLKALMQDQTPGVSHELP